MAQIFVSANKHRELIVLSFLLYVPSGIAREHMKYAIEKDKRTIQKDNTKGQYKRTIQKDKKTSCKKGKRKRKEKGKKKARKSKKKEEKEENKAIPAHVEM